MGAEQVLERLWNERATAILRVDDHEVARQAMDAAVRGGFRFVEFTLGCPGALDLIEEFSSREELTVGVGTVLDPEEAEAAVQAGAEFVVSPVTDEAVIEATLELDVVAMPGGGTATEMTWAYRFGAQLQKFFPAPINGPEHVRMLLGPLPFLRIVPTSGVTAANVNEWIEAGAFAVGFVGSLFDPEMMAQGDFAAIETRARECLAATHAAQRPAGRSPQGILVS